MAEDSDESLDDLEKLLTEELDQPVKGSTPETDVEKVSGQGEKKSTSSDPIAEKEPGEKPGEKSGEKPSDYADEFQDFLDGPSKSKSPDKGLKSKARLKKGFSFVRRVFSSAGRAAKTIKNRIAGFKGKGFKTILQDLIGEFKVLVKGLIQTTEKAREKINLWMASWRKINKRAKMQLFLFVAVFLSCIILFYLTVRGLIDLQDHYSTGIMHSYRQSADQIFSFFARGRNEDIEKSD